MTVLPVPVKQVLREPLSEHAVARVWARLEAGERREPRRRPRAMVAVAFALAGAGVALAIVLASVSSSPSSGDTPRGPVALAGGAAWQPMRPTANEAVVLDDGSLLALTANAEVKPVANTATDVVIRQPRGTVVYDIAPHQRRWTIDCGVASVEVVGTRFRVDHDVHRVRVDVERGLVVVRGRDVPGGAVRLRPGMHVEVATDDMPVAPAPASSPVSPSPPPPPPTPSRTWRELAAHGANAEAYARLGRGGVAATARTAAVEELFALADVARLSGHAAEAVDPLQRIIDHHANDPRAALAALTLGRVDLRSLDAPAAAVHALEVAIARGLPADLGEDAGALHVEALARAGQADAARAAYARFAAQFPGSARLRELPAWLHDR